MDSPRYLTKSRFKLAVECPTKLFYTGKHREYRDSMEEDAFLAMLAEGGYQVGTLAKLRYPDGIEIHEKGHAEAEAQTLNLLASDFVVLFEPAIRVGNLFIRIDILVKAGNHFELIEVKAKSYNSIAPEIVGSSGKIKADMLPYIQDAAFQTLVLQRAYPGATISTALMMPDKACIAPVDGINQMFKITSDSTIELRVPTGIDAKALAETLLAKVDINSYVGQVLNQPLNFPGGMASIEDAVLTWADAYADNIRLPPRIGAQCGSCQFKAELSAGLKSGFHECWKIANEWVDGDFSGGTVLNLWNCRRKQKLIDKGVLKISQVQKDDLGDFDEKPSPDGLSAMQRQWFQVDGIPDEFSEKGYYFDEGLAHGEITQWRFPYHFIDFETAAVALPFHSGMRPYEQVAFQFSHHVMDAEGHVRHAGQFLCVEPGVFPNYEFARALKGELEGDDGTVFMWSHHENTILSRIRAQLVEDPDAPDDASQLQDFLSTLTKGGDRAMVDLCALASKTFFHPETNGSSSIKKVLPAILKVSSVLNETYSQPIYGAPQGIASLNFAAPNGIAWIEVGDDGSISDPYAKLRQAARDLLPDGLADTPEGEASIIAEGGAAATAYARLQFEDLNEQARKRIESALLRYCELDTLAMVMVVQAWRADLGGTA